MSNLDDLYKESGITRKSSSEPNTPDQFFKDQAELHKQHSHLETGNPRKGIIVNVLFYVVIFGGIFVYMALSGTLGDDPTRIYYIGIAMSIFMIVAIRKLVKGRKRK